MPDLFDQAQERVEIDLAQALRVQKERAVFSARVLPAGYCHNQRCGDEFESGDLRLFCGPACAKEFEKFER